MSDNELKWPLPPTGNEDHGYSDTCNDAFAGGVSPVVRDVGQENYAQQDSEVESRD